MVNVNIHPVERVVRGIVGLFLISLIFWGPKSLWGLIGLIPLLTALLGWCPPYSLLGINTCNLGKRKAE
ncbi:MAG: YgaP family membrane protein [Acidobacteriota bacterium]